MEKRTLEGLLETINYGSEASFVLHPPGSTYEFDPNVNEILEAFDGKRIRVTVEAID